MRLLNDRGKRRAIIVGTSPLPARFRVAARNKLLLTQLLRQARRCDIFIVRHPKTGGTWLRVLITRLFAEKYGVSSKKVVRTDELQRQHSEIPVFLSSTGFLCWSRGLGDIMPTDPVLREKKLLLQSRHPGDIVVSWYLQFTKRTTAFKREMLLAEMEHPIDKDTISRWDFIMHPEIGLPRIIEYYNYWYENFQQMPNAYLTRYEDLRNEPEEELARIAGFLGGDFTAEQVAEAVEFASFEKLREKEQSGYFDSRGLKLRDASDPETLKVRRGKVAGYRDDLSAEKASIVEKMIEENLNPAYGYGGGAEPVKPLVR